MTTLNYSDSLAEKLISLGEISALSSVEMKPDTLLALFASKLHTLFGAKGFALWTLNLEEKTVTLRYGHDLNDGFRSCCQMPVPIDLFPEVKFAIESGTVWTTDDLDDAPLFTDPNMRKFLESMSVKAVMGIPVRALMKVMGAISIYYTEPQSFTSHDTALGLAFANSLALSLNNIESYERVRSLERVKGEVIDIVAHQFRTPIATLRGNVELLKDESIWKEAKTREQIIEELEKVGNKLRMFVESFLNVKAIDEGNLALSKQSVDINTMVEKIVKELDRFREQHNIKLEFTKLPAEALISVDQRFVSEALLNVINNAIKYAKANASVVLKQEGNTVILSVKDDGAGIPVSEQPMIFQKLYRATNVARHPEASSGLGLYIAKQYIESNGGKVWFTSEGENKGTNFFVSFPIVTI